MDCDHIWQHCICDDPACDRWLCILCEHIESRPGA